MSTMRTFKPLTSRLTPAQVQAWAREYARLTRGLFLSEEDLMAAAEGRDRGMTAREMADVTIGAHEAAAAARRAS